MTETPAEPLDPGVPIRLRNWLDSGYAEPYHLKCFRGDLHALLADRDQLTAAIDRTTKQLRRYRDAGVHDVNIRQALSLLSPDWPHGNYASIPQDDPQPPQDAIPGTPATPKPDEHPFEPQQPTDGPACKICGCTEDRACEGGCYWFPNRLGEDICSACAFALADAIEGLAEQDLDEQPTLRDIDPDAVHATEDNDYWEEAHEAEEKPPVDQADEDYEP